MELAPVPETWGLTFRWYRYVYTADDVILVDPTSRRVVEVIDQTIKSGVQTPGFLP